MLAMVAGKPENMGECSWPELPGYIGSASCHDGTPKVTGGPPYSQLKHPAPDHTHTHIPPLRRVLLNSLAISPSLSLITVPTGLHAAPANS